MKKLFLLFVLLMAACGESEIEAFGLIDEHKADGRHGRTLMWPIFPEPSGIKITPGYNGIYYHGGPVIVGTVSIYYIWYGDWEGNTAIDILNNFAYHIGGSPYYNINTTYYDWTKTRVSNSVVFGGAIVDNYSKGNNLSDADIRTIVARAIIDKKLPTDPNGVYFVLTSSDVSNYGFCSEFCGWHSYSLINGVYIKYSFVGNSERCLSSCASQYLSPNNNPGADGMVSVVAHELVEAVTDPNLDAWYDKNGEENADKCSWSFGNTYYLPNGSKANMNLGGMEYLIQQNWVNANGGYCALSY